ncbi:outer membrane protein OmpA [Alcaligenes endophyticus]|uniref:OmpA family protein n=1 Tax=Alcaligenes endophyticus TaxID=1929088 RepID=A0ABT8EI24_9BURK|nr:OmpA family protein [Alcaligenes endophyticus]MCX5592750.1 OmpA family protein [Alcaligenes endophyticus]MDN4120938.1 OmpA family protein [Alcaligenes endophyticus]
MNKPSKIALVLAIAAVSASSAVSAQSGEVNNWRNPFGDVWKNGTQELCWRDNFWTPATGVPGCDGVPVAEAPAPVAPVVAPTVTKVTLNADTFFDFDKYNLKPEGRQVLDQVAAQVRSIDLETVIATGYTDSIGTDAYNLKLSDRRANTVKQYLIEQGVPADRIYTEGKGKADPIASNKTREGRAQNRRVEIEIVGNRK